MNELKSQDCIKCWKFVKRVLYLRVLKNEISLDVAGEEEIFPLRMQEVSG
jgi:hypothetical protein